jgi:lysozyme
MNNYTLNQEALQDIMKDEGCVLKAYKDTGGVWTIGYGHTRDVKPMMTITKEKALELLDQDMDECVKWVNSLHLNINQNQFTALCDIAFNAGPGNMMKWGLITLIRLNPNDPRIADKINSNGIHDRKGNLLQGLVKRRAKDVKLYYTIS